MTGYFAKAHAGFGFAIQDKGWFMGKEHPKKRGATFSLAGALGYNHTFLNGFMLGGAMKVFGRGFFDPITQKGLIAHPIPEFNLLLGWAF